MKNARKSLGGIILPLLSLLVAAFSSTTNAEVQSAQVLVQELKGPSTYSIGGNWQPLHKQMTLTHGAVIKTGVDAKVDLLLQSSGSALRLRPNSELRLDKLTQGPG